MSPTNLQIADRLYTAGQYKEGLIYANAALRDDPDSYWAKFLLGQILLRLNSRHRALCFLEEAALNEDPARIGAKYVLAFERAKNGDLDVLGLLEEVIAESELTEQKRWYYSDAMFLRAMIKLRKGLYSDAENDLLQAYSYNTNIDERRFSFDWVGPTLGAMDLAQWPTLEYLKFALSEPKHCFSYEQALECMPEDCFVLEIGANDGVKSDALYPFITSNGWTAVMVEPVSASFSRLCSNYAEYPNVKCVNAAITVRDGPVQISAVAPESLGLPGLDRSWAEGISSLVMTTGLQHYQDHLTQEEVQGITFLNLAEKCELKYFDVLQIDTEGYDYKVFRQIDVDAFKVRLVHIEFCNLMPIERLLIVNDLRVRGFELSYDGVDLTARRTRV